METIAATLQLSHPRSACYLVSSACYLVSSACYLVGSACYLVRKIHCLDIVLPPALKRAVELFGVEVLYTDTWGRSHFASEDALRRVLDALGVPLETPEATEKFLDHYIAQKWAHPLDSTVVVYEDCEAIPLRVPADHSGASVKLEIELENGELQHHWFWLPELQTTEDTVAGEVRYLSKRLPLPGGSSPGLSTTSVCIG